GRHIPHLHSDIYIFDDLSPAIQPQGTRHLEGEDGVEPEVDPVKGRTTPPLKPRSQHKLQRPADRSPPAHAPDHRPRPAPSPVEAPAPGPPPCCRGWESHSRPRIP